MAKYLISALSLLISFMFISEATINSMNKHYSSNVSLPTTNVDYELTNLLSENIEDIFETKLNTIFLNDDLVNADIQPSFLFDCCISCNCNQLHPN
ncbi:hypothetical protein [Bacillus bombysepticus]|uniref:hypothetical protein n=1 Tax=Bacillus bombysepticus TaxID=658666 RepID=UPI00301848B0